jgi:hypothetical protein
MAADRCLSLPDRALEDESNKIAVLTTADARMAVAFTGVATDGLLLYRRHQAPPGARQPSPYEGPPGPGRFRTASWLADAFCDLAESASFRLAPLLEAVTVRLTNRFRVIGPRLLDARLTIVLAGYYYRPEPEMTIILIRNYGEGRLSRSS